MHADSEHCPFICFEPDPPTFDLLRNNICGNSLSNAECFNFALWDNDGTIEFFSDRSQPGSLLMSALASRMDVPGIRVPARRLSQFIKAEIDYLKLDIEGAELRVLEDLSENGKLKLIKQMGIEYHHRIPGQRSVLSKFLGILEENGFEYQILTGNFPDPGAPRFQDLMIYAHRS